MGPVQTMPVKETERSSELSLLLKHIEWSLPIDGFDAEGQTVFKRFFGFFYEPEPEVIEKFRLLVDGGAPLHGVDQQGEGVLFDIPGLYKWVPHLSSMGFDFHDKTQQEIHGNILTTLLGDGEGELDVLLDFFGTGLVPTRQTRWGRDFVDLLEHKDPWADPLRWQIDGWEVKQALEKAATGFPAFVSPRARL